MSLQQTNLVNLEAAHGRIMDVDVALESSRLARNSVAVQASAAMVAQANQLSSVALSLLQ
jgi:flagellin